MDIGFSGFRKVIELGMMSRWPTHRSDSGACGTRTRSPAFAPNSRCAVSSVIRRRASSRSPGAQKNGLRVLRANSFGLVRPAYTADREPAVYAGRTNPNEFARSTRKPFFCAPGERDDARLRITEDTAHRGLGAKAGEHVRVPQAPLSLR